jgi:hypothetical protein
LELALQYEHVPTFQVSLKGISNSFREARLELD